MLAKAQASANDFMECVDCSKALFRSQGNGEIISEVSRSVEDDGNGVVAGSCTARELGFWSTLHSLERVQR